MPSHGSAVDSPGVADWSRLAVGNIIRTLLSVIQSDRITTVLYTFASESVTIML